MNLYINHSFDLKQYQPDILTLMAEPKQDNLKEEQQIPDRRPQSEVNQIEDSLGNDYVSGAPLLLSLLAVGLATVLVGYVSFVPLTISSK